MSGGPVSVSSRDFSHVSGEARKGDRITGILDVESSLATCGLSAGDWERRQEGPYSCGAGCTVDY